jgi:hypothetical protein
MRRLTGFSTLRPAFCIAVCALVSACAPARVALPTDAGTPLSDYAQILATATTACRSAHTMTAELSLSGRAGGDTLRGRVLAGFERPASMRLEGVAPFGAPAFILVARDGRATLLLPREHHVVRDATAEAILGALAGVALAPADLEAVLTGCVVPTPNATAGRLHADGWASIDLEGGATAYLRRAGDAWQIRAARRGDWRIDYPEWGGTFPATVRLQSEKPVAVDLTATLAQVEANIDLDPSAFAVAVPADATPLPIDVLRRSGPLQDH